MLPGKSVLEIMYRLKPYPSWLKLILFESVTFLPACNSVAIAGVPEKGKWVREDIVLW